MRGALRRGTFQQQTHCARALRGSDLFRAVASRYKTSEYTRQPTSKSRLSTSTVVGPLRTKTERSAEDASAQDRMSSRVHKARRHAANAPKEGQPPHAASAGEKKGIVCDWRVRPAHIFRPGASSV